MIKKYTYKYRIYPTLEQEIMFSKIFGCVRYVYNYFLDDYKKNKYRSKYEKNNICNGELKEKYPWLREVDKFALTNSIYNLDNACKRYMNKISDYPKYKNKRSIQSYQTNYTNNNIEVSDKYIKLPKLKKIKAGVHRKIEGTIVNATVKKYPSGKYYVMILVRKEIKEKEKNSYVTALDMGVKTFITDNIGREYISPKSLISNYEKIGKMQRKLSRMLKGSNNYEKMKKRIAKAYEKSENIRNDFLHKLSNSIINDNQVIIIENLDVKSMFQEKMISKILGDISISKFINMLEYKAKYYGRKVIKVNRYYASSQICSNCGYKNKDIKDLSVRNWECPICNSSHSRDINAAINILDEGIKYLFA